MTKETILNYLITNKQAFQREYEVEKIGLFGSYARDEANVDSDIDIFVQMKPDLFKLVELKEQTGEELEKRVSSFPPSRWERIRELDLVDKLQSNKRS